MSSESKDLENLTANLVIIGGGGSGLAAAATAAEMGLTNIVVVEKHGHFGGNSAMAMGFFACESPVQKAEMIDCRADECFKIAMDWAHWRVNPRIVRAFFDKSGDTIRWFEDKGFKFRLKRMYPNQKPVWHIPEGFGKRIIEVLTKDCEKMGVKLFLRTSAEKIMRGDDGEITGVMVRDDSKEEYKIKTKSVLISSGGFAGNKELLKKYCPDYNEGMRLQGTPFKGDGIFLAAAAGAATADSIPLLKIGCHIPDIGMEKARVLRFIVQDPSTVWLNTRGIRFIDEAASFSWDCVHAILKQPDNITFSLFDDNIRQEIEENGLVVSGPHGDVKGVPGLKNELKEQSQLDNGRLMKIAENWEDIAYWMNLDPEILKSSIDEYNSFCDHGRDRTFAKDSKYLLPLSTPPFYAVKCCTAFHETMGGIKVNEHMEAIDKQGNIIPGLYAAGVIADDWVPRSYWSELCGSAFGFAINSGRIAGESVAGYILSK